MPFFEDGSKVDVVNYRPICFSSVTSKAMEHLFTANLGGHIGANHILCPQQNEFWRQRSCVANMLLACESISEAKSTGYPTGVNVVDFSMAYDKVPYSRLLLKLQATGVDRLLLCCIVNFPPVRSLFVRIARSFSRWFTVASGLPRGSVPCPLLFLVYFNDLPSALSSCPIYVGNLRM